MMLLQMCTMMRQLIEHNPQPVNKHVTLSALLVCSVVLIVWVGVYYLGRCLWCGWDRMLSAYSCIFIKMFIL